MTRQEIEHNLLPKYHYQTAAETFDRIPHGTTPWVAIGDFLDDWRRAPLKERSALVGEPLAAPGDELELRRWAAFCAATVEWLCWQDRLPFPAFPCLDRFDGV